MRKKYVEKDLSIDDLRKIQLGILKYLSEFCEKYGIKYYLFYGSLLGAVRHEGYIPWDDDIDIAIFREDYEKFFATFNKEGNKQYKAISIETDSEYYLPMGKVIDLQTILIEDIRGGKELGVYVDVFPIDYLPNDMAVRERLIKKLLLMKKLLLYKQGIWSAKRSFIKNILYLIVQFLSLPISNNYLCKKINFYASQKSNREETSILCGDLVSDIDSDREIWHAEFFKDTMYVKFENMNMPAPAEYDAILRTTYGDYMELPPKEEQKSHHHSRAFWR